MICKYCNRDLPEKSFYFDKTNQKFKRTCKACSASRRALQKDRYNRRRREYYAENKEEMAQKARAYYQSTPAYREKRLKQFSDYYMKTRTGKCFSSAATDSRQTLQVTDLNLEDYVKLRDPSKESQQ